MVRYNSGWATWVSYVGSMTAEGHRLDPFLSDISSQGRALHLANLVKNKCTEGKRKKAATGVGAALRMSSKLVLLNTDWFEAEV